MRRFLNVIFPLAICGLVRRTRVVVSCTLAALSLAACGGGDITSPPVALAPAPAPASPVQVTGNTQLAVNTSYSVNATGTTVTLTLPALASLNDTVNITGTSATAWTLAQNANQTIHTSGLNGNTAPGTVWTPRLASVGRSISSDATGEVLIAPAAAGDSGTASLLHTSRDGGQTWTADSSTSGSWISSDMTPSGIRMVAAQDGGGLFTSTDFGTSWNRLTNPLVDNTAGLSFQSVTISADGQNLAAVIAPTADTTPTGRLQVSNDGGTTWTAATLPPGTYEWRSVDNSADGKVIVAVAQTSETFISIDAGASWTPLPIVLTGQTTPWVEPWYRVKMSADGNTIALVGGGGEPNMYPTCWSSGDPTGSGIFVSHDRGATWTRFTFNVSYTAIAMSSDGKTIAVSSSSYVGSRPGLCGLSMGPIILNGHVVMSTDGGATFAPLTIPGSFYEGAGALAMSADGNKLAAVNSLVLYTSVGNRTSIGTSGAITGQQNDSITLKFIGNGQWAVQNSTGGPFTVR